MEPNSDLIRLAQREYKRAWRKRNPDKEKQYQQRYWLRKAAALQEDKNEEPQNEE